MAYLPRTSECKNGCGAFIYFDKDSKISHPELEKWIPLAYNQDSGVYTGEVHNCPNNPYRKNGNNGTSSSSNGSSSSSKTVNTTTLNDISVKLDKILSFLQEHTK
jgi:hypothetical protein